MTVKILVDPHVAEYVHGKFYDAQAGAVRFPSSSDIYVLLYDLLQRRPADHPVDSGNLELCLPVRREGKDPATYNYLSGKAQRMINEKLKLMFWAELHDRMDEGKHLRGERFADIAFRFARRYGIESISEDALLKNYQRWRNKLRRAQKRTYQKKSST